MTTTMKNFDKEIFEALGEASMCWSETPKGIFDSSHAKTIGDKLTHVINARLEFMEVQRLTALKNAFSTIEAFAIPSCDPEMFQRYEELRDYLIKMYTEGPVSTEGIED